MQRCREGERGAVSPQPHYLGSAYWIARDALDGGGTGSKSPPKFIFTQSDDWPFTPPGCLCSDGLSIRTISAQLCVKRMSSKTGQRSQSGWRPHSPVRQTYTSFLYPRLRKKQLGAKIPPHLSHMNKICCATAYWAFSTISFFGLDFFFSPHHQLHHWSGIMPNKSLITLRL